VADRHARLRALLLDAHRRLAFNRDVEGAHQSVADAIRLLDQTPAERYQAWLQSVGERIRHAQPDHDEGAL
jgi:hypothetical protein